MARHLVSVLFLIAALFASSQALSCLNRQGHSVAWFNAIKLPGTLVQKHPRYAYVDAVSGATFQAISGVLGDSQGEPIPNTIEAINHIPKAHRSILLFNDEPPGQKSSSTGAHAKGIIAFDSATNTGVYILHSIPRFPSMINDMIHPQFPESSKTYAQHIYCISLNKDTLDSILENIPVSYPNVYEASGIFQGRNMRVKETHKVKQFHLVNGEQQWFLTKGPSHKVFIFEDIVSPYFGVPLATESWGRPYQGPHCVPHKAHNSVNILKLAVDANTQWGHTSDHSKWTISYGTDHHVACLCDMNRMDSQRNRGGSCMCTKNANLYRALAKLIVEADRC